MTGLIVPAIIIFMLGVYVGHVIWVPGPRLSAAQRRQLCTNYRGPITDDPPPTEPPSRGDRVRIVWPAGSQEERDELRRQFTEPYR